MAPLKTSLVPSPITRGVIDGTIKPRGGIELDVQDNSKKTVSQVIEENSKAMVAGELDVAEMSFGTYMCPSGSTRQLSLFSCGIASAR